MHARAANVEPRRVHILSPSHLDSGLGQRLSIPTDVDDQKMRAGARWLKRLEGLKRLAKDTRCLARRPPRHDRHDTTPLPRLRSVAGAAISG